MKISSVYIIVLLSVVSFSCGESKWKKKDRDDLKKRCLVEGGSRSYCNCYLENAMAAYPNAQDVYDLSFEEAVELSLNCE